jgi:single-strand DNA-binding protein
VTVFGQRAETLSQYLKKGSRVFVEGRLEARPWTDQQGQVRAGLEVMAGDVEFMSSRADDEARGGGMGGGDFSGSSAPRERSSSGGAGSGSSRQAPAPRQQDAGDGDDLEDLPF